MNPDLPLSGQYFTTYITTTTTATINNNNEKRAQRRHKHCALAVVRSQKFLTRRRPTFPAAQDGQNLISWRWSLPSRTNPVW